MSQIPAAIGAQLAIARQDVALSFVKQSAQADQAVAGILEQAADNLAAVTGSRGTNVNISA